MGEMNFNEFCGNTSLHGWRFVPGTAGTGKFGIVGRAIWIFIVVSSIGVAAFFIAVALNDFFSSTGKLRFKLISQIVLFYLLFRKSLICSAVDTGHCNLHILL